MLFDPMLVGWAMLLFTIAALTDTCDGYLARRYGLVTELGNFLDPLADKVLIFSIFSCFYLLGFVPLWFVCLLVIRDISVTWLRSVLMQRKKPLKTSVIGKWKTTLQIVLVYLIFLLIMFQQVAINIGFLAPAMINSLMYGVTLITLYSGLEYFIKVMRS